LQIKIYFFCKKKLKQTSTTSNKNDKDNTDYIYKINNIIDKSTASVASVVIADMAKKQT